MSEAVELLNSLDAANTSLYLANSDEEAHIVIDSDRFITVPDELKRIAVQYDHNVETVTFDCPRYWDEHDMSTMTVYINYLRSDQEPGVYEADNVRVDDTDTSIMHFDWTVSRNVTASSGNIVFLVCVKRLDDDGVEQNHWNSELCKACYVSPGLELDGNVSEEIRPDIIEEWYRMVTEIVGDIETMRDNGDFDGIGITSIEQTVTSTEDSGENVITVVLSDGQTQTFTIRNGSQGTHGDVGIESFEQTTLSNKDGGENVVTVTLTDGTKQYFVFYNGSKGSTGATGATGATGPQGPQGESGHELLIVKGYSTDGVEYAATVDGALEVVAADSSTGKTQTGKGRQIIFVPGSISNITNAPTLSLDDGEAIPIRLRADKNQGSDDTSPDATKPVPIGALMVGVPYTMTFCGKYWLVDSYIQSSSAEADGTLNCATTETEAAYMRSIAAEVVSIVNEGSIGIPLVNDQDGIEGQIATAYIERTTAEEDYPDRDGNVTIPTVARVEEILASTVSAKVEQTDDGAVITVTDSSGTTTATIKNGQDGTGSGSGTGTVTVALPSYTADDAGKVLSIDSDGNLYWTEIGLEQAGVSEVTDTEINELFDELFA